ncbi:Y-family DNA polymerase [Aureimonas endophytica]|uniref:Y-family DNA polymerase n=1 Tax=Aureimonas endophytica TaxID=2027858 RepID=UPI001FCEF78D|nr:DNA polymerase Y family protein [Aureimonas endophytica]
MPPLVLFEREGNADRVAALCETASAAGLRPGLGLAEARARFPGFDFRPREREAEARLLGAVADWCDRYTPLVAVDAPFGLLLDISGCAHLFGGEKALVDDLLTRLFALGLAAEAVVASHPGAALALVGHVASGPLAPGEEAEAVRPLPVEALRLDPELAAKLRRLGLKRVGQLLDLPRESLAKRFGEALTERLAEASGRRRRPISPRRIVPSLIAERRFAEPIALLEDVERVILFLAARLERDLERRGEGGRRFELSLFRLDGHVEHVGVGAAAPVREAERIARLFRERLAGAAERPDAGFGYDLIRLGVPLAEAMPDRQVELDRSEALGEEDLVALLDRLSARLGEASVTATLLAGSHWPERAERRQTAGAALGARDKSAAPHREAPPETDRPTRLLDRPEPVEITQLLPEGPPLHFRWRRALHVVKSFEGPERIAAEWWRDAAAPARDYYRIEDERGRRYWLFRQTAARDAARPDWFMHGLFA